MNILIKICLTHWWAFYQHATVAKFVVRPVIYIPLPLCSEHAGVNGAIAIGGGCPDGQNRQRKGPGRHQFKNRRRSLCHWRTGADHQRKPEHLKPTDLTGLIIDEIDEVKKDGLVKNPDNA